MVPCRCTVTILDFMQCNLKVTEGRNLKRSAIVFRLILWWFTGSHFVVIGLLLWCFLFFIFLFFYKLHISELICLMFLANNKQFWQFRKKHNITRSYLWSFTRPNVFSIIVKKKFICLFGIPRFFSKIQLTYGMRLNLFCKSLAYICCKCLHIEIF